MAAGFGGLEGYEVDDRADVQVHVAWDRTRDWLVLYVFNLRDEAPEIIVDLSRFGKAFGAAHWSTLDADDLRAMHTVDNPDTIKRVDYIEENVGITSCFVVGARPHSFIQVVLE